MKPLLSVLIPTYKRLERLKKTFPLIVEEVSNEIEFIIIDNASEDGTEYYINDFIRNDSRIRYFKNPVNIGPNRNIYRGYLESKGDWFIIIPDDDFIGNFFLKELLVMIKKNKKCGLIIPCLENQPKVFNKTTIINKGIEGLEVSFKNSGAIMGLTFNKNSIVEKEWLLDGYIYPQIRLACEISLLNDIIYFVPKNPPIIGDWGDKVTAVLEGRPTDFGIIERLEILIEVSKKIKKRQHISIRHTLSAGLFFWTINIAKMMYLENQEHTFKYIKSLLQHKFIKSSCVFLGLLVLKLVLNKQIFFIYRIKILGYVLRSILTSLFNINFYSSLIFCVKNIHKTKQL